MFIKLFKNDLKRDLRWMWILFVFTIAFAGLSRGCKELGDNLMFFKILSIVFDSVFYSLLVNVIIQPFLRSFMNFTKSFYGDESYLTHTLPVTKNQLFNSKFLTAVVEIVLGFACLVVSLLIRYVTPTMFKTLKLLLSTVVSGNFQVGFILSLFIALVVVEFLMFISIILFSVVIAYRAKEKRVLKTFLLTVGISFIAMTVLSFVMAIVLLINKVNLNSSTLVLTSTAFTSILLSGIIVYSTTIVLFYFLAKKEFSKGVNVD